MPQRDSPSAGHEDQRPRAHIDLRFNFLAPIIHVDESLRPQNVRPNDGRGLSSDHQSGAPSANVLECQDWRIFVGALIL